MRRLLAALLVTLATALPLASALAVEPDERLDDPVLEERARALSKELRCVVCQNQSIDDSNADLARDLRVLLRERLAAGDSDAEVKAYLVERYGEFVLLKPPVNERTYLLWITPPLVLLLGALAVYLRQRHQRSAASAGEGAPLAPDEKARLDEILKNGGDR